MKFSSPYISWQKALIIALLVSAGCIALRYSPIHPYLEEKIIMPTNFQVRAKLGRGPGLDPRIKIFAMDDPSYWYLAKHDLSYQEWALLFSVLSYEKPNTIIVDKIFDAVVPENLESTEFRKSLNNIKKTKIVAGAWINTYDSPFFNRLDLNREEYQNSANSNLKIRSNIFAFGPDIAIQSSFHRIGHIHQETIGKYTPVIRLDKATAIPHISFFASDSYSIGENNITVNNYHVPLDYSQKIQVNLDSPEIYKKNTLPMFNLLKVLNGRASMSINNIRPGDTILILPGMTTGNFDRTESSFGMIPGGYLIAAMVNSVITGKWLYYMRGELAFCLIGGILGSLIGLFNHGKILALNLALVNFFIFISGMIGFTYYSTVAPWFYPMLTCFTTGSACFAFKSLRFEQHAQRLTSALRGVVPDSKLAEIVKKPWLLDLNPRQKETSILFADIIGFSIIAEKLSAEDVFSHLKTFISALSVIAHKHGGIVDSTPGDGLLVYFGHSIDGSSSSMNHELQAINCAIEMQMESARWIIESEKTHSPALPIRIGINTDQIFIGDLGGTLQVKPTVIGHAVNFAKRLESACDFFCIMVGQKTKMRLCELDPTFSSRFEHRPIHIKHRQELIEAYELDPLIDDNTLKNNAIRIYRSYLGIWRQSDRFSIPSNVNISIKFDQGSGRIVNFSERGIAVVLTGYLGKDVTMAVEIDSDDGTLKRELSRLGLINIVAEVKWGRPYDDGYLHGLALKNLNKTQSNLFLECMNDAIISKSVKTPQKAS